MIWNPFDIVRAAIQPWTEAGQMSRRWKKALNADPTLRDDLIKLGGVAQLEPQQITDGSALPLPPDPYRLAYEAGRRDFALTLLALSALTYRETQEMLMEASNEYS